MVRSYPAACVRALNPATFEFLSSQPSEAIRGLEDALKGTGDGAGTLRLSTSDRAAQARRVGRGQVSQGGPLPGVVFDVRSPGVEAPGG